MEFINFMYVYELYLADSPKLDISVPAAFYSEIDFLAHQAKLQKEARSALAKSQHFAKEKMMINKQQLKPRRIHEIICQSLEKVLYYIFISLKWLVEDLFLITCIGEKNICSIRLYQNHIIVLRFTFFFKLFF